MRDFGLDTIQQAHREGWALGAFSTYGLETTMAILQAAERVNAPVILQAGSCTFVQAGREALAALGNVHGMAAAHHPLDLGLLRQIRDVVPVPLVLHGASGLPKEQLRVAVGLGVAKVNVNTELRRAVLISYRSLTDEVITNVDLVGAMANAVAAVRDSAQERIVLLSARARDMPPRQARRAVGSETPAAAAHVTPEPQQNHQVGQRSSLEPPQGENHAQ